MHLAICDDDMMFAQKLQSLLLSYFNKKKLPPPTFSLFSGAEELLCVPEPVDILFLDIELDGLSGIHAGRKLKKRYPELLIFIVTSYMEYLDDAMRFRVFRYLSKPLEPARLFRNLDDAISLCLNRSTQIAIETRNGLVRCSMQNILCVEACNRNILVHTTNGVYESVRTMQYWSGALPSQWFFQTHRSFIVNMKHVTDFDHSIVHLQGSQVRAYLTHRRYSAFKDAFLLYLERH